MCGTVSDLHAADARYHKCCRVSFFFQKSTSAALKLKQEGHDDESVISILNADKSQIWNSVELYTLYVENGGSDLSRRLLVTRLLEYFGDNLVALSCPGIATVLAFRSGAAIAVAKLKKKICQEVNCFSVD